MSKRIYVGNLPFSASEEEIRELFAQYGAVESVNVISDRYTGQPRGFAFVEMPDDAAAQAIAKLNETDFGGRRLRVNEAKPREDRGGRDRW